MNEVHGPEEEGLVGDLVIALLAVNGWGLDKTFPLQDGLRAQGLFDPDRVAEMLQAEVFDRLERAGYRRAQFMVGLLAGRLRELARSLSGDGKKTLRRLVDERDAKGLDHFLLPIKGIGPQVVRNFQILRGIAGGPPKNEANIKERQREEG